MQTDKIHTAFSCASLPRLQGEERVALRSGLGRVLARDVISPLDVPGHDNSAMDGYALDGAQLPESGFLDLEVIATLPAGGRFDGSCGVGQCVRIMTGAPIPAGTDTVVMQEQVLRLDDGRVRIGSGQRRGQNVRRAGEDIAAGSAALEAGKRSPRSAYGAGYVSPSSPPATSCVASVNSWKRARCTTATDTASTACYGDWMPRYWTWVWSETNPGHFGRPSAAPPQQPTW